MDVKQLQESMNYEQWKDIMVWIKNERKKKYKETTDDNNKRKNDEFDDPIMDEAIRQIPSEELKQDSSKKNYKIHI